MVFLVRVHWYSMWLGQLPVTSLWLGGRGLHGLSRGCPRVCPCVCVCGCFFPGSDREDEVSILDGAGLSFLPLPWPEAPRVGNSFPQIFWQSLG